MPTITLTNDQVVELIRQLPPTQKHLVLLTLAEEAHTHHHENMVYAEQQLRMRAAERGFVWDELDDDAREAFVDDLIHEDR
ncbi:MAG: hypothetical protein EI684_12430 [Candidatus Viridilinea halotolerans]|uniref:Uncharacterized protein n=1 Tax=Candidatus Viridilinea halotolerans TaxID=2491704 RepID=A0A426TY98_9CHLR|nr:MAG: hypothetical protein EI684_12430 [Candidatus Viridilinea halotolerans]